MLLIQDLFTWLSKQWKCCRNKDDLCTGSNADSDQIAPIQKNIWILWLQGWDQAPEIVQSCLTTWKKHNVDWTVHALTASSLDEFLDEDMLSLIRGKEMEPEAFSDVIRLALLQRHGGVWVDSTVYCLRPLNTWLYEMLSASGFFAFSQPSEDRMLSSWFLAAPKGNYIIQQWLNQTQKYWLGHTRRDDYFWVHQLFKETYYADEYFRELWDITPNIPASKAHYYSPYNTKLYRKISLKGRYMFKNASSPMQKLTHKIMQGEYPDNSVLRYLCDKAKETPYEAGP